jgi:hypothetical protein
VISFPQVSPVSHTSILLVALLKRNCSFRKAGEWIRLHNKELYALYSSLNIIRVIKSRRLRWAGHLARMEERRGAYRALVGKPEGRRPLERPRRRWKDNIKMDLREVRYGSADWVNLAQDRDRWRVFVYTVKNLRVP